MLQALCFRLPVKELRKFCCLSDPDCGIWLWQPQKANTTSLINLVIITISQGTISLNRLWNCVQHFSVLWYVRVRVPLHCQITKSPTTSQPEVTAFILLMSAIRQSLPGTACSPTTCQLKKKKKKSLKIGPNHLSSHLVIWQLRLAVSKEVSWGCCPKLHVVSL